MKILIGADSRSVFPMGDDWVVRLTQSVPEHEIKSLRAYYDHWLFSIYIFEEYVQNEGGADLLIVQAGWHEGVCFWSRKVFEGIVKERFNSDCLTRSRMAKAQIKVGRGKGTMGKRKNVKEIDEERFLYIDHKSEREVFDALKSESTHCLFIGMHSLRTDNSLQKEYLLGDQHQHDALAMHDSFSNLGIDFLHMPMDPEWVEQNTVIDKIHYLESGVDHILGYVSDYIELFGKTTSAVLESKCTEQSSNFEFYQEAKCAGSRIAALTKEGDVVLLARRSGQLLFSEFVGSILYNRKPLIVQTPSQKVHAEEFQQRMEDVKDAANPSLCICDQDFLESYSGFFVCSTESNDPESCLPLPSQEPEDVAFLQMSSGTTGTSKVVEVTHKQLLLHCYQYAKMINLDSGSVVISWLPLYHDMGLIAGFILPLVKGAHFEIIDPFEWLADPAQLIKMVDKYKGTHMWMPSFAFNYMAQRVKAPEIESCDLSSLQRVVSCSEPTFLSDIKRFYNKFEQYGLRQDSMSACYALAENVFAVSQTCGELGETTWKEQQYTTCGKILPGVSVIIMRDGRDVTGDDDGQVMIRSSYESHTNAKSDFHGYYDTGDIGFMKGQELYIIGRAKDAFVSYGKNVYPAIVEQKISELPQIIDGRAACFGVFNEEIGTHELWICAETNESSTELRLKVSGIIKGFFDLPSKVHLIEPGFLVKTSSGKISRSKTMEKYGK